MKNESYKKIKEEYWSHLRHMINLFISNAPLYSDKQTYVKDCWDKLEAELQTYDLPETDFKELFIKLRKEIENKILR
jgi:hypothetical protein